MSPIRGIKQRHILPLLLSATLLALPLPVARSVNSANTLVMLEDTDQDFLQGELHNVTPSPEAGGILRLSNWTDLRFDDSSWAPAHDLGPYTTGFESISGWTDGAARWLWASGPAVVWLDDSLPPMAAVLTPNPGTDYPFRWSQNPVYSGRFSHTDTAADPDVHQHFFVDGSVGIKTPAYSLISSWAYIPTGNEPKEVMLQWKAMDGPWGYRAYWGNNLIPWGTDNTSQRRFMGPIPPSGTWVNLQVPFSLIGLNETVNYQGLAWLSGMAFTAYGGEVYFDRTEVIPPAVTRNIAFRKAFTLNQETAVSIDVRGKDRFTLYLDGKPVLSGGSAQKYTTTLALTPGQHQVAVYLESDSTLSYWYRAGLILSMRRASDGSVILRSDGTWKALPSPQGGSLYKSEGYRISQPVKLPNTGNVKSSAISWQSIEPQGASVAIEVSLDGGATWSPAQNGAPIAGLHPGSTLQGQTLLIRETLRGAPALTPQLERLTLALSYTDDSAGLPVQATVGQEILLSLQPETGLIEFGRLLPSGSPFDLPAAVGLTLKSNVPWVIVHSANPLRASDGSGALPPLQWHLAGSGPGFGVIPESPAPLATGVPTESWGLHLDLRQEVPWSSSPGAYQGIITYTAIAQ